MTEISFHHNVPDRLGYACRLVRKATRLGSKVVVSAPDSVLGSFDRQLWVFEPLDFIAHIHVRAGQVPAERMRDTPVWLTTRAHDAPHHDVLLNLGDELVDGFESFSRVIELVSADGDDRQAGRMRWKHYRDRGYPLETHDVAQEVSP